MNIVAISGKRRSGKSTLANILRQENGYMPLNLADPLKDMVRSQFDLTYEQTDGHFKESPTNYKDASGKFLTPRDIMISVGQFYRSIDENFWTKKLFQRMEGYAGPFTIADVRFKNELTQLKERGAFLVRLERSEQLTGKNINDSSETELDAYSGWDLRIKADDNVTLENLYEAAKDIHALMLIRS